MPDPKPKDEMTEQEQAEELQSKLLGLQTEYAEFNTLWTILEDACAELKKRIRRLELNRRAQAEERPQPGETKEVEEDDLPF